MIETLGGVSAIALTVGTCGILLSRFRVVVSTNEVHIVQHTNKTSTYGKDQQGGNVYYHWPAWLPNIGVRVTTLPSAVFRLHLTDYPAYDKGRVPFILDVIGFFRINDFSSASSRVANMADLQQQLDGILKGAMRSILASSEIEEILQGRSQFGEMFTEAVDKQLTQWGVSSVKAIELMDIRDADGSKVIANIMAKKKSLIEKESRVEVADNIRAAEIAEIEAKQAVEIRAREQEEMIGRRAASRDQAIGIQQQQAAQAVAEEKTKTTEKEMDIKRAATVRTAQIEKESQIINAEREKEITVIAAEAVRQQNTIGAEADKQVAITSSEGTRQSTILTAEGTLESQKMVAEARRLTGLAEGEAQQAVLMAPVNSQIALAKEIGSNQNYQTYLISLKQIEATQLVGVEAAKALEKAGIKIISTAGSPMEGLKTVMDVMTPKGATQIGAALEAFSQTPIGQTITSRLFPNGHSVEE